MYSFQNKFLLHSMYFYLKPAPFSNQRTQLLFEKCASVSSGKQTNKHHVYSADQVVYKLLFPNIPAVPKLLYIINSPTKRLLLACSSLWTSSVYLGLTCCHCDRASGKEDDGFLCQSEEFKEWYTSLLIKSIPYCLIPSAHLTLL